MCVKFLPEDLNLGPCLPHPTSTYTCGVVITPKVYGSKLGLIINTHYFTHREKKVMDEKK